MNSSQAEILRLSIKENFLKINERIALAALKTGRSQSDITLVAVTKNADIPAILEAKECGIHFFAENRVQDAAAKIPSVPGVEWHMIGHLQSNKVKPCLELFRCVQSLDSVRLAEKIQEELLAFNRTMTAFLEVNISGESQKHGFMPDDIYSAVDKIKSFSQLEIKGVMGIAPNSTDPGLRRAAFKKLKGIYTVLKAMKTDRFEMKYLSMGMSDDYDIAIEEGSNMIRIGSALFGGSI